MVTQYGMSESLGAVKFGQESGEVFLGRDIGHQRDYSEAVAAQVDAEVRSLIETAHHEAWEILVEYRDVLDEMVLRLLDKETLTKDEVLEVFAAVDKRPERQHPTGNGRRPLSDKPPVLTPAELAVMGPADLEDLARGRTKTGSRTIGLRKATAVRTAPRGRSTVNREADGPSGQFDREASDLAAAAPIAPESPAPAPAAEPSPGRPRAPRHAPGDATS